MTTTTTKYFNVKNGLSTGNISLNASNGTIVASLFSGNGASLFGIPGANVTGAVSSAGTVTTNAQPNITSTGTLTSLEVSGDGVIGGNLVVNGSLVYVNVQELAIEDPIINLNTGPNGAAPISNSGKDIGAALNYYNTQAELAFMGWDTSNAEFAFGSNTTLTDEIVTFTTLGNVRAQTFKGNVESTTIAGNLSTAAQPNITSTGTLTSLAVTGNITGGNISSAGTINANYLVSNSGCVAIGSGAIAVSGTTGGIFNSYVTDINLGTSANIVLGSSSGNVTVQGNIVANHNVAVTGNVSATTFTGNVTGSISGSAATVTTNAQPNITSVGTLTSLSVTGNVSAGNADLGNAITANYFIGNGYLLTGVGNATAIVNGNSNVSIPVANGDVKISATGTANVLVITGAGASIAGNLSVTGNSNLGNISNVNITGGESGQYITTDGFGNLTFGNVTVEENPAPMPTYVAIGDTLTISANYQGLFGYPITVDGDFVVDGILVDVNDATVPGGTINTVQFNDGTQLTGTSTFTFIVSTGVLSVPNITTTGVVKTTATTYSGLPLAGSVGAGSRAFITDANTITFLAVVGAGGSNSVPVVSNGTTWVVG